MIIYPAAGDSIVTLNGWVLRSVFRLELHRTRNVTPIIPYNSRQASYLVPGPEIVEGSLAINFLTPNYLVKALSTWAPPKPSGAIELEEIRDYVSSEFQAQVDAAINEITRRAAQEEEFLSPIDRNYEFDLVIYYDNEARTTRTIKGCRLTSEGEVLSASPHPEGDASSSGSPIIEQYSFVAKTVTVGSYVQLPQATRWI